MSKSRKSDKGRFDEFKSPGALRGDILCRVETTGLADARLAMATLSLLRRFLAVEREFGEGCSLPEVISRRRRAAGKQNNSAALAKVHDACRARALGRGVPLDSLYRKAVFLQSGRFRRSRWCSEIFTDRTHWATDRHSSSKTTCQRPLSKFNGSFQIEFHKALEGSTARYRKAVFPVGVPNLDDGSWCLWKSHRWTCARPFALSIETLFKYHSSAQKTTLKIQRKIVTHSGISKRLV